MSDQLSTDLASLRIDRDAPSEGGGKLRILIYVAFALAALAAIWFLAVPAVQGKFSIPKVQVATVALVSPSQAATELTATGYVVPQKVSRVSAKVSGRVTSVNVEQGDEVKEGDVLMVLDALDLDATIAAARARVMSARANVATAQANLGEIEQQVAREREGAASGISAGSVAEDLAKRADALRAQVKAAQAQASAAQAEVDALKVNRGNYTLASPIAGRVLNKPPQIGEVAGPSVPGIVETTGGIEIADFASLAVETDVPEGRLGLIKVGGPAEIVLDAYSDRRYRGAVLEIVPKVDRAKATVMVRVKFVDEPKDVLPEMSARVSFLTSEISAEAAAEKPKLIVPGAAVAERAGAKVVFVLEGDRLRMMPVELGPPFGAGFELKKGPAPGTKVVMNPSPDLVDGKRVKENER